MSTDRVTFDFSGCRVLVTGGTNGIGAGIARAFHEAGAEVVITGTRASVSDYPGDHSGYTYQQLVLPDKAGIERHLTVHSTRHTFAMNLYRQSGDLRLVQTALGHRHISTTEIYARVEDKVLRRALEKL